MVLLSTYDIQDNDLEGFLVEAQFPEEKNGLAQARIWQDELERFGIHSSQALSTVSPRHYPASMPKWVKKRLFEALGAKRLIEPEKNNVRKRDQRASQDSSNSPRAEEHDDSDGVHNSRPKKRRALEESPKQNKNVLRIKLAEAAEMRRIVADKRLRAGHRR
jgi:hypothetical protein